MLQEEQGITINIFEALPEAHSELVEPTAFLHM